MQVQSIDNQYLIQIEQSAISLADLQKIVDYLRFKSIVTKSQATEADITTLANEVTESGWSRTGTSLLSRIKA